MRRLQELSIPGQQFVIRADLNVPLQGNEIASEERIVALLPTLQYILQQGGSAVILSHLGRPPEGQTISAFSLKPVAQRLSELLHQPVDLLTDLSHRPSLQPGQIVLGENVRFLSGEEANSPQLARQLANLGDIVIMEAFATAHRTQASTVGLIEQAKVACGGFLLQKELEALQKICEHPQPPVLAIVGGSKISSKFKLLRQLLSKVEVLIPGGGIANTLLAAQGHALGKSLVELNQLEEARQLLSIAKEQGIVIALPIDVVVAPALDHPEAAQLKPIAQLSPAEAIFDVGPQTMTYYAELIQKAKTILWNGPLGVFEVPPFDQGTRALCEAIGNSSAFSVAGGGDTVAAIEQNHATDRISYISTAGGAFLEFLQGDKLPVIRALEEK